MGVTVTVGLEGIRVCVESGFGWSRRSVGVGAVRVAETTGGGGMASSVAGVGSEREVEVAVEDAGVGGGVTVAGAVSISQSE